MHRVDCLFICLELSPKKSERWRCKLTLERRFARTPSTQTPRGGLKPVDPFKSIPPAQWKAFAHSAEDKLWESTRFSRLRHMEPRDERMLARLVVVLCKYRLLVYSGLTHKCCRRICGPRHVVEIVHNVSLCRSLLLYYYSSPWCCLAAATSSSLSISLHRHDHGDPTIRRQRCKRKGLRSGSFTTFATHLVSGRLRSGRQLCCV